ncbi:uroporphyrin-III C-methyltransferase hemX [Candidatus Kinetoplastibacterium blastocrithidii TCC012E]|uniref:Uroporphyrin-III C-methyltransferase hemX n=1 Tax=Candidatus Kinetoplastidibacterium blastocrithidiae TCC012E TaxID=1208922 RepID=M1LB05_9PROT|nr:uroporphyrinogen-III C-methyltransferase [Candidatus Kinetoplastibacterium blastocrithidii]AFZ83529.1 hypothetical protein CKBE_00340 [Candidatus Kinetoplastibacterium blastocrithidii (ex Strigomonas culicis)]AGF49648.1 uroporphyrin-III C-methyltransferase hemX [Candidatus Kinetoplastibacterium blastocrithidii TCC012E]
MHYFKKVSLFLFLFFVFSVLFFFLKKQLTEYIEFEKLENIKRINSLEEKIISHDNDLLYKANKLFNDIKHKQDYLVHLSSSTKDELLLREIDRLLFIANCQLSISNNIEGAAFTLESIILFINEVSPNNLLFNKLMEDIRIDLFALRKSHAVDFSESIDKLNRLSDLIKIGFIDKKISDLRDEDIRANYEDNHGSYQVNSFHFWMNKFFDVLNRVMRSLVVKLSNVLELRKIDSLPDISHKNINLLLSQQISIAQFSLVANQPSLLKSSINCITETINTFFDLNSIKVIEALSLAGDINSLNIENKIPDISRSLNSIKKICCSNIINN